MAKEQDTFKNKQEDLEKKRTFRDKNINTQDQKLNRQGYITFRNETQ